MRRDHCYLVVGCAAGSWLGGKPQNFRKSVIPDGEALQRIYYPETPPPNLRPLAHFPQQVGGEAGLNGCTGLSEWETTLKAAASWGLRLSPGILLGYLTKRQILCISIIVYHCCCCWCFVSVGVCMLQHTLEVREQLSGVGSLFPLWVLRVELRWSVWLLQQVMIIDLLNHLTDSKGEFPQPGLVVQV